MSELGCRFKRRNNGSYACCWVSPWFREIVLGMEEGKEVVRTFSWEVVVWFEQVFDRSACDYFPHPDTPARSCPRKHDKLFRIRSRCGEPTKGRNSSHALWDLIHYIGSCSPWPHDRSRHRRRFCLKKPIIIQFPAICPSSPSLVFHIKGVVPHESTGHSHTHSYKHT